MEKKLQFKPIAKEEDIHIAAQLIAAANIPVAKKLGLTPENAPSSPAFMTAERLTAQVTEPAFIEVTVDKVRDFFMLYVSDVAIGTVAIEASPDDPGLFFIERLAVLPEAQGKGYGVALMNYAHEQIRAQGGSASSVAIINENTELKAWYEKIGYRETAQRVFEHLPFTVCFMKKELS